ncbi:hypothetical protein [uncultured Halomonas sp.]|uniref:hypothetical protein n=1 Tax=uncultured Halomonas sp. TaxID=173971 RepID=UPI00261E4C90|nr:hypothetical protein [uncultured Halomonas sp.]
MSITEDAAKVIASEVLDRNLRKYGMTKSDIRSGSYDSLVKANAWATGVEITTESGEKWTPSPWHMLPGSANHAAAAEAEAKDRLRYIVSEDGKLERLIEEASRHKVAFGACRLVFQKLLEQGEVVPSELAEFAFRSPPKEQGGAAGKKDLGRACLVESIYELAEIGGLPPTGNDENKGKPHNASHYIAMAAGISVSSAKAAWKESKNPMSKGKRFIAVQRP